jgi:AraC-like DNA-binding protein
MQTMSCSTPEITTLGSVAGLIATTLRACGCDPEPLFVAAGLDSDKITDPNARFPMLRMQKLWKLAIEATGDPCLGLAAARQFQPALLHGLGLAWLVSDTLLDAFGRLVRYARLINNALDFRLEEQPDFVYLVIVLPKTRPPDFEYAALDLGMAAFLRMCQITAGHHLLPRHVSLQRPEPPCPAQFEEIFGPSIDYRAPSNRVCFDRQLLTRHLASANPELARINDQVVVDYLARFDRASIAMQVRSKIIHQLPDGIPTQETIADTLHVSLRSLQRKLKEEDTSFRDLLEDTRQQLALQYLRDSRRSIGEITYLLGFTEPSNFTRAFKRWTGKSPAQYRLNG